MTRRQALILGLVVSAVMLCCVAPALAQAGADAAAAGADPLRPLPAWQQLLDELLTFRLMSIPVWRYVVALLVVLLGFFTRTTLLERLFRPLEAIANRTQSQVDDTMLNAARRPLGWIINVLALYLGLLILRLPEGLGAGMELLLRTSGTILVAWLLFNAVEAVMVVLDGFTRRTESELDDHLVPLVRKLMRVVIIIITVLMIIQQWGYDVTSLIAGLGLGGLAFALAAQNTLSNLFGSVMIFTDRPFKIGDWVQSKNGEGVVEEIGLRSTRVRTFANTLITIPNADMASTAVENHSKMTKRRIMTTIGVVYGTTPEQVERIVTRIRALLRDSETIDQGFHMVNFTGFGTSSLDILIYCFTKSTVWTEFMQARQELFFEVMKIVREEGSSFALPSQSLYFETSLSLERELDQAARSAALPSARAPQAPAPKRSIPNTAPGADTPHDV